MKRFRLAGLLGILILSGGCESTTAADPRGTLWGLMEGQIWVGDAVTDFSRDTLVIWSARRNVRAEQSLVIRAVETSPGVYALVTDDMSDDPTAYWETLGGDVATYRAAAESGTIRFSEVDRATGRAAGTLELTFRGERGASRFVRGEFNAVAATFID
jgi:hypothetical protein